MEFKVKSLSSTKITIQRELVTGVKPSQKKTKRKRSKEKTFELRINLDSASTSATRKSESVHDCFNGVSDYVGVSENKFGEHNNVVVKSEPAWDEGYGVSAMVPPVECNGETSQLAPSPDFAVKSEFSCAFDIENATIVQVNMEPDADIHADIFGYKAETEEPGNLKTSFVTVKKEPDIEYPINVSNIKTEPVFVAQSNLENSTTVLTDLHNDSRGTDNNDLSTKIENVIIKTEPNQSNDERIDGCSQTEDDFELEIDLADEILEEVDQDRSEDYVPSSDETDEEDETDKPSKSKKWKEDDLSLPVRFGQLPADPVKEESGGSESETHNSLDKAGADMNVCGVCGITFQTPTECMEHLKAQHQYKGLYACMFCSQVYSDGSKLLQHEEDHREEAVLKRFRCIECGEFFSRLQHMLRHMRMHTGNKVYNCPDCDKVFTQAYTLTVHRRLHSVQRDHKCKECGASFHRPGYLKHHMRKHTGERPFICKDCGKSFSNSSNLSAHIRTHTGEKPYKCSECLASFATSSALTVHRWRHTDSRPFRCEECEKTFTTANTYKRHKLMHMGLKEYQCSMCGKNFSQKSSLTIHMRVHTGYRPFFCTECGATFTQSAHLTVHVRKHTGERPFACKECDKSFPRSEYLLRHKRNVHGHLIPKVNRH